jgi:hypothetical protein
LPSIAIAPLLPVLADNPLGTFRFGSSHEPVFSRPTWRNEISAVNGVLSNRRHVKFGIGG